MPKTTAILVASVWEDTGLTIMARLRGNTGAYILQADFSGIAASVFPIKDADNPTLNAAALTVSSVVFDTLQTTSDDPRWTADGTGFNFLYTVPASAFATPGKHRLEIVFNPSSGDDWPLVYTVDVKSLYVS